MTGVQTNVFAYGRGTENRTLIYGLKARYFAVKLYPHYGPSGQIRTDDQRIKSPLRYHCATKGWFVIDFLLRAIQDHTGV